MKLNAILKRVVLLSSSTVYSIISSLSLSHSLSVIVERKKRKKTYRRKKQQEAIRADGQVIHLSRKLSLLSLCHNTNDLKVLIDDMMIIPMDVKILNRKQILINLSISQANNQLFYINKIDRHRYDTDVFQ